MIVVMPERRYRRAGGAGEQRAARRSAGAPRAARHPLSTGRSSSSPRCSSSVSLAAVAAHRGRHQLPRLLPAASRRSASRTRRSARASRARCRSTSSSAPASPESMIDMRALRRIARAAAVTSTASPGSRARSRSPTTSICSTTVCARAATSSSTTRASAVDPADRQELLGGSAPARRGADVREAESRAPSAR